MQGLKRKCDQAVETGEELDVSQWLQSFGGMPITEKLLRSGTHESTSDFMCAIIQEADW